MAKTLQSQQVDVRLKSPSMLGGFFADNQFWKRDLTNNDFLMLYKRGGIGFKVANKIANDLFDKGFETNNQQLLSAIKEYDLNNINWFAYLNAYVSGYSLVFIGYGDNQDFSEEANINTRINYFYIIPRAWVQQDKFHDQRIEDYYIIYRADGSTFKIHESRVCRYSRNDNEMSAFEPAYNALVVCDNILWSSGQTLWRVGQGFPVLTIDNPQMIQVGGVQKSEVELLQESGPLKDINSETGFVADSRYNFKFAGAEGVALRPAEYWNVAFTYACVALEVPKQLVEGTSAGVLTGSETNLKDYYSDLSSKQVREVEKLYIKLIGYLGINATSDDFEWNSLFEQSNLEIADTFNKDSLSLSTLKNIGAVSNQEIRAILTSKYNFVDLNMEESIVQEEVVTEGTDSVSKKKDEFFKRAKYKKEIAFKSRDKNVQKIEDDYLKRVTKRYTALTQNVVNLIQGFNTDAITESKFSPLTTKIGQVFANEEPVFQEIVKRFIDESFNEGLQEAIKELELNNSLINFSKADAIKKILGKNAIELNTALLDNILKDITLLLTDVSLNNIPFKNSEFKEEIQSLFGKRLNQLESQVVTEITRGFNQALEFGFKESGVVTHKMWQSVIDDRTTEICLHLNGEIAELGQPFSTGDYQAPAHINCRSRVVSVTLSNEELSRFRQ